MDNMERELFIRDADPEEAKKLVEIYSYYVLNTAVSFEYEVPSVADFEDRIVGYAYAGPYSSREAYNWTATTSIYVDKDYRRQGIGSLLYKELEKRLKEQGIVNLLAGAAYSDEEDEYLTHDSYKFHTRSGYTKVAHMKTIGKKFDRWYDLLWMQKKL